MDSKDKDKPIMYSKSVYKSLCKRFKHAKRNTNIIRLSYNTSLEWLDVKEEREYLQENINAIKRGVNLVNILIIPKNNVYNVVNNFALKELHKNDNNMLFIIKEEFEKYEKELYEYFYPGTIIFGDKEVIKDSLDYKSCECISNKNEIIPYLKNVEKLLSKKQLFLSYNGLKIFGTQDNVGIRPVSKDSLPELAEIYANAYKPLVKQLGEKWTKESAVLLLNYWYKVQPDLFLCAYDNKTNRPVGAIVSGIKPWWDGPHLNDAELFVGIPYQNRGIGTALCREHYRLAIEKYRAMTIDFHTFARSDGYPLKWYLAQKLEVVDNLYIVSGDIRTAINRLSK